MRKATCQARRCHVGTNEMHHFGGRQESSYRSHLIANLHCARDEASPTCTTYHDGQQKHSFQARFKLDGQLGVLAQITPFACILKPEMPTSTSSRLRLGQGPLEGAASATAANLYMSRQLSKKCGFGWSVPAHTPAHFRARRRSRPLH